MDVNDSEMKSPENLPRRHFERPSWAHIAILLVASLGLASNAKAATHFVTTTGVGDCSTWANACSLSTGLTNATSGDEVWVKAGTYSSFSLVNGVKIIGGFAGTETAASQSDPAANATIVDGGGTLQCVWSNGHGPSTVLRGWTLQNGHDGGNDGGGALVVTNSSALFVSCIFKNNQADMFGGAIATRGLGTPEFISCIFHSNGTGTGTSVKPLGGGVAFVYEGTPKFTNCLFYDNVAGEGGVSLSIYGVPTFLNCTFADNEATIGAGGTVFDEYGKATVKNSIFWGNTAASEGNQIYNSPIRGTTSVINSDIQGGFAGTGNIDADPLFLNPITGDYDIPGTSPCYNAGVDANLPNDVGDLDWNTDTTLPLPRDLEGVARRASVNVDMGAYEAVPPPPPGKGGS